jgi:hypothetical protein
MPLHVVSKLDAWAYEDAREVTSLHRFRMPLTNAMTGWAVCPPRHPESLRSRAQVHRIRLMPEPVLRAYGQSDVPVIAG